MYLRSESVRGRWPSVNNSPVVQDAALSETHTAGLNGEESLSSIAVETNSAFMASLHCT